MKEGPNITPATISPRTEGSLKYLNSSENNLAIIKIEPSPIKNTIIS